MTGVLQKQKHTIITIFLLALVVQAQLHQPSQKLKAKFSLTNEKLTHFRFYVHDILSILSQAVWPTVIQVAEAAMTDTSKTGFGATVVVNDPLTAGPELTSKSGFVATVVVDGPFIVAPELTLKILGRAQGMGESAELIEIEFMYLLKFIFSDGKYKGSTLSILGSNKVSSPVREMLVMGGTGLLRFARGYALTNTRFFGASNDDATLEYNA